MDSIQRQGRHADLPLLQQTRHVITCTSTAGGRACRSLVGRPRAHSSRSHVGGAVGDRTRSSSRDAQLGRTNGDADIDALAVVALHIHAVGTPHPHLPACNHNFASTPSSARPVCQYYSCNCHRPTHVSVPVCCFWRSASPRDPSTYQQAVEQSKAKEQSRAEISDDARSDGARALNKNGGW